MCKNIGYRCNVCTECGRCTGVQKKMSVIMADMLPQDMSPIPSMEGRRLVTVDIGTTTIAMQLYDTDGGVRDSFAVVNPQTAYGADVLSRIQAAEDGEKAEEMKSMVREALGKGFAGFKKKLSAGESLFAVIAANTAMVYLLMGYDAKELGQAPFHASHLETIHTVIESVSCVIFPGLSAFVGGDITAGIYGCGMAESEELTLLIDLGTNGEIVLGNRERIIACATAAGPAFEGGVNRGVWGADMISLLSGMKQEGLLDETGLIAETYFDTGVRIGDVCVTQAAVRAVQLAKGAVRAGIQILAQTYAVELEEIQKVVLAGGFGYYLDPVAAASIGLLPRELTKRTVTGGNTALTGALRLGRELLTGGRMFTDSGTPKLEILNLAQVPGFEELYIRFLDLA